MEEYVELKKENERLKELNICVGCENNPDYKSRCEKAIEEIKRVLDIWENKPNEIATLDLEYLLNILQGNDEE